VALLLPLGFHSRPRVAIVKSDRLVRQCVPRLRFLGWVVFRMGRCRVRRRHLAFDCCMHRRSASGRAHACNIVISANCPRANPSNTVMNVRPLRGRALGGGGSSLFFQ
jgi:hypothetical protein